MGDYKRTWQGALAALLLYLYKLHVVRATTILTCPYVYAPSSCPITHPHVFFLRPPCFPHVPWHHTFNLRYTCAHHVYTMRNPCPLISSLTLTPSRLFPILLDPKSFQTVLDYSTWLPGYVLFFRCRLIINYLIYVRLTLTLAKVCPHFRSITWACDVLSIILQIFVHFKERNRTKITIPQLWIYWLIGGIRNNWRFHALRYICIITDHKLIVNMRDS